jgi:hypothetical protein
MQALKQFTKTISRKFLRQRDFKRRRQFPQMRHCRPLNSISRCVGDIAPIQLDNRIPLFPVNFIGNISALEQVFPAFKQRLKRTHQQRLTETPGHERKSVFPLLTSRSIIRVLSTYTLSLPRKSANDCIIINLA